MSTSVRSIGDRVLVRAGIGLGCAALLLGSSVLEAVGQRGLAPDRLVAVLGPTVLVLAVGVILTPFSAVVGSVTAVLAFPLQLLLERPDQGIGGTVLIMMMLLVAQGAVRLPSVVSGVGAVCAALIGSGTVLAATGEVFELLFFSLTMGAAWAVGWLLRRERTRSRQLRALAADLAAERERSGRLAVMEERTRISRELHDAVAHSVSVMTLQVGVIRRRLRDQPEAEVLRSVEELGRRSVDELRRVVGALRTQDGADLDPDLAPAPSLRRLEPLVAELAAVGLAVTVGHDGDPVDLAPAMDVSTYRIVAEALTNVLRHAGTDRAEVHLRWHADRLEIEVLDRGRGTGVPAGEPGHGVLHMRERAALFGGGLDVGPRDGGGFRVHAMLPLGPPGTPQGVGVATGTGRA